MDHSTHDRIAEAAMRILAKEGADAVSMRRIARAIGITPMAIYHHFPDRDALLQAITAREFDRLAALMAAHPAEIGENSFTRILDFYIDYAFQNPRVFDYLYSHPRPGARQFPKDFRERQSPTMNRTVDELTSAIKSGVLRKDDIWELGMMIWALIHGYVALYRAGRIGLDEKQFRALCHRALRRLFHGLKA